MAFYNRNRVMELTYTKTFMVFLFFYIFNGLKILQFSYEARLFFMNGCNEEEKKKRMTSPCNCTHMQSLHTILLAVRWDTEIFMWVKAGARSGGLCVLPVCECVFAGISSILILCMYEMNLKQTWEERESSGSEITLEWQLTNNKQRGARYINTLQTVT